MAGTRLSPGQTIAIAPPPADNIISITNTVDCVKPPVNALTVQEYRSATVVPQLPSGAVFPVQVVCDPSPSATLSLTATALQQYLANIPAGSLARSANCRRWTRKFPEGCTWSVSYPNGQGIVIPAQGTPTLTVLNTLTCKPDLAITKTGPVRDAVTGLSNFAITVTSPGGPFTVPSGGLTVTDTMTGMGGIIRQLHRFSERILELFKHFTDGKLHLHRPRSDDHRPGAGHLHDQLLRLHLPRLTSIARPSRSARRRV